MSQLAPRVYMDEFEQSIEIRKYVRKKRYNRVLDFLITHFDVNNAKVITVGQLQEYLRIVDRRNAFEILEGLKVLGILNKMKNSNRVRYMKNTDWWDVAKKEFEKNGN